ncbi:hypothetical protein HMPREF9591_01666 [Cutibacterium acnes HL086PA1]|nr:Tm-1-like ATP-binding domain-containing protein [Cutibacterium acnes]EFS76279.1 hypothetical protein HMPREF9591_01666 [Cutibacterium acnes HL086PA1]
MSSGDARAYVGQADVTLMYSVVNVADINHVSRMVFANASAAIAAMVKEYEEAGIVSNTAHNKLVAGLTMSGLTPPAADEAARLGYEVLVFHTTDSGEKSME